ncbi:hypothetical protein K466DRAFT_653343 [Polyporus arcularius HHB13444]|uniref:Uncharacterized protein n=1 Tax=Polyporus arcularius HHB13444 TaxID=1314778 RepID=A0A5C3PFU0_9APHY|nr:hypothetical protein K466DRAFT_653343 [Polyporus arcularius HHB13444]
MAASTVITTDRGSTVQVLYDKTSSSPSADPAIANTLAALVGPEAKSRLDAGSAPFAIASAQAAASTVRPSTAEYLKELAYSANAAAASVYCGSVLAGHTSEADEYGDIAVFLGPGETGVNFGPGHERDILDALGLGHLLQDGHTLEKVDLSSTTSLPPTINVPSETGTQLRQLVEELKKLKGTHAFYVRGRLTVYFLVGRSDAEGWVGLAGIGVQT